MKSSSANTHAGYRAGDAHPTCRKMPHQRKVGKPPATHSAIPGAPPKTVAVREQFLVRRPHALPGGARARENAINAVRGELLSTHLRPGGSTPAFGKLHLIDDAQIDRVVGLIRQFRLSHREQYDLAVVLVERFADKAADFVIPGPRECGVCGRPLKGRSDKRHCDATCRQRAGRKRNPA